MKSYESPRNNEQASGDQSDATEYESFEEHMRNLKERREQQRKYNLEQMARPSLKNEQVETGVSYLDGDVTAIQEKLKKGEALTSEDILNLLPRKKQYDGSQEVFDKIGLGKGFDFDVELPKSLYDDNGNMYHTDLKVSFGNPDGTYTRASFTDVEDGIVLTAVKGSREACDVGYRSKTGVADVKPKRISIGTATFDYKSESVKDVHLQ